mmetsp:Transcript_115529/g.326572  ORF Transcript_115529/g.326572 Transcript_115529/m.326572 type:complete len:217 (+) Transcript_115529:304-954(+)
MRGTFATAPHTSSMLTRKPASKKAASSFASSSGVRSSPGNSFAAAEALPANTRFQLSTNRACTSVNKTSVELRNAPAPFTPLSAPPLPGPRRYARKCATAKGMLVRTFDRNASDASRKRPSATCTPLGVSATSRSKGCDAHATRSVAKGSHAASSSASISAFISVCACCSRAASQGVAAETAASSHSNAATCSRKMRSCFTRNKCLSIPRTMAPSR